jgi:hypothetical protein
MEMIKPDGFKPMFEYHFKAHKNEDNAQTIFQGMQT